MLIIQHIALLLALGQSFETASVRLSTASSPRSSVKIDAAQATLTNVTLSSVIQRAYTARPYQIDGPDWLSSRRFNITGKIPTGATPEQVNAMFRNLLAERYHLALRHETRPLNGYELIVGRNGPKLKPPSDSNPGMTLMEDVKAGAVVSTLTARAQPVSELINVITREFRLPVIDKTGLAGKFDFAFDFAPQAPGALPAESADLSGAPNLLTAVQQLGLKLNPAKVPADILVIEHADQTPTEN